MTPWWVAATRGYRRRQLVQGQRLVEIDAQPLDLLRDAAATGNGLLIVPNHAVHYDGPSLYVAADRIRLPLYFMTAWQVFAMSSRWERWGMQRLGCFSVDRESADRNAFKQAVQVLRHEPYPLVVFPEGDIYHTTDVVTSFRDGAAAIALAAAKRSERPILVVPCGIKFWYLDDPTESLLRSLQRIEDRLYLRPATDLTLAKRIRRLAEAALALKELDYFGKTSEGRLRDRIQNLLEGVLAQLEQRHGVAPRGAPPERVKVLRQSVIRQLEQAASDDPTSAGDPAAREPDQHDPGRLATDMEDLFFAMQLFSYRGDYLADQPSIERLAETVDKFEEDILGLDYPTVHGRRHVAIRFGEPRKLVAEDARRGGAEALTQWMQQEVQRLVDGLNDRSSAPRGAGSMAHDGAPGRDVSRAPRRQSL